MFIAEFIAGAAFLELSQGFVNRGYQQCPPRLCTDGRGARASPVQLPVVAAGWQRQWDSPSRAHSGLA